MFLTRISVNQPVFATMVMLALVVFGIYSYQRLPVEQLPDVDFPVVAVVTSYPGASPEAVEADIVRPIEDVVNTLNGIDSVQSTARSGSSMVLMTFDLEVDSATAAQEVREKIAQIEAILPENAGKPRILRFDPNAMPILSLAVSSDTLSPRALTALAEDVIVKRLSVINGVGSATLVGGINRQFNVLVDPDKLVAFNVSMAEVLSALKADNQNRPAGSVRSGNSVQSIQVEGEVGDRYDFLDIVIARRGGQPVMLGDIATVEDGQSDESAVALINGQRALSIDILKVQGTNTVEVADAAKAEIQSLLQNELPEGVHIEVVSDSSITVNQSFHAVQNMLVEGALLAVVIVFVFLNSWRSTVITGLTLPISIIGAMIALYFFGFTLNMMTMMALSLSVGILIDDAIVVRENIMRHLHMGKGHRQAALDGTNEIGLAVLATTLSIVAVFLPVAFMDGILGRFFLQFGVTVSVAVLISLFVAFTLDPMLSSVWYDPSAHPGAKRGPIGRMVERFDNLFARITQIYRAVLTWSLRHRLITVGAAAALFVGSFFLVPLVGAEFQPAEDNGEFQVAIETPVGSSLEYTQQKVRQVEAALHTLPEVERTYATLNSGRSSGENKATVTVALVDLHDRKRSSQEMTTPAREAIAGIPGINAIVSASSGFGGISKPIQINMFGDSFQTIGIYAEQLAEKLRAIPGLTDVETSLEAAQPIIGISLNRQAASDLGVSASQVSGALSPMFSGEEATTWTDPRGDTYDVFVRLPEGVRTDPAVLGSLPIASANGTSTVLLDQVATIEPSLGPGEIVRQDGSRRVQVSANLSGVTLGNVSAAINEAVASIDMPLGYRISQGGEAENLGDATSSAGSALLLAVIFIYLVLASQFGSFLQPIAIMISLPLSLVGVMLGLLIGGSTLNIMSMIGFIMLMGLVVKNAILLVDNANQHVRQGMPLKEALVEAGTVRFRPIVMTSLAMIFGMLPLALSLHEGSSGNAPMAHAVIGGLISSTLLTLVVVPVILTYLDALGRFASRFLPKSPAEVEAAEAAIAMRQPAE